MSNKTIYLLGGVLVVIILFLIIAKKTGMIGNSYSIEVATEKPQYRKIIEIITANGKIQPETEVKISADVSGEIVDLFVQEGDSVKAGDLLLRIKPDIYTSTVKRAEAAVNSAKSSLAQAEARLAQSEAQFKQIKAAYERSLSLWKEKTISDADYEQAKAQYESTEAEIRASRQSIKAAEYQVKSAEASQDEANENLSKTSIYAPIGGIVSLLNVEKGERVVGTMQMAGTEIMRLADLNKMEVVVDVNENDIVLVKTGDTAVIEVDAYLGMPFSGIVTEISNSANTLGVSSEQVTNFEVKVRILPEAFRDAKAKFPENKFPFRPGMTATTDIQTNVKYNVLTVPIQTVTTRSDSLGTMASGTASGSMEERMEEESADENKNSNAKAVEIKPMEVVFVVEKNKALLRLVKTGIQDNLYIEIVDGLSDSADVVVAPYNAISRKLKDQSEVKVVDIKKLFKTDEK
jgi:HlyD family secretion protein